MKLIYRLFLVTTLIIGLSISVYAGTAMHCNNCGFNDSVTYSLGRNGGVIAIGYCDECEMYVAIWYNDYFSEGGIKYYFMDGSPMANPMDYKPINKVLYQGKKGSELRNVYPCPYCSKAFMELYEEDFSNEMACPRCGEKSLEFQTFLVD